MIVNLTPHSINLRGPDGSDTAVPASGLVARVASIPGAVANVTGVPVPVAAATTYGAVEGLPDPVVGTWLIVSGMVGAALAGTRGDVLMPGTGPNDGAVRNEKNQIIGVTRLIRGGAN